MNVLSRRSLLKLGGLSSLSLGLPQSVLAQDDFSDIPYRESGLGIDYHAIADFPVDHMLSQGEAEWFETAPEQFGAENAERFWNRMAPLIGEGRVSETFISALKLHSPNMLLSFARLPANHPKYGLIEAYGSLFQLEQYQQGQQVALNDA